MSGERRRAPEQVIGEPREAEVETAEGTAIARACEGLPITENAYDRRRREYGGMEVDRAKRPKELEEEDARLKRPLADAEPDEAILSAAAPGRYRARRGGARRSSTSWARPARAACRGAGRARSWGSAAPPSGGRPPSPTTSRGW